jgi:uncharacterized protein YbbK (DUF523 family)
MRALMLGCFLSKKKVIISACLLGDLCRYDGKIKKSQRVVEAFEGWEVIPFCPEAPLFGTPRERISVVKIASEYKIISDESNQDHTQLLQDEIAHFIAQNPTVDAIVLKSKSPSCGLGTTPILDIHKQKIALGDGIAAKMFQKFYKNTPIRDENSFS